VLTEKDTSGLMKATARVIREAMGSLSASLASRIDSIERRIAETPAPKDGHTPTPDELRQVADAALADAWAKRFKGEVDTTIGDAVKAIPVPRDGEPGRTPTAEDIQPLVAAAVADAVKAIPVPKDGEPGRTPTAEDIQPLVAAAVADAVKALPSPRDGETPGPEVIQPLVDAAVATQLADVEQRSYARLTENTEGILGRIRSVEGALHALPTPRDGETPGPDILVPLVEAAVKALPVPKDGHTPTAEEIRPLVAAEVAKAVPDVAALVDAAVKSIPAPKDGEPGRDALDLHVLPAIDVERAYPRGSWAKHLGGLWRSFEATDGMRGWECIVEGVATLQVEQEGDRKFVVKMGMSSGAAVVKDFSIPVMIYRGVYRENLPYEPGDTVTWGGSTWTCKQATQVKPSEGTADWVLSVKRGRDGKAAEGVKL